MKKSRFLTVALVGILLISPLACRNTADDGEGEGRGEGEEPGVRLAIDDTYNAVRNGVRLILRYDSSSSAVTMATFSGVTVRKNDTLYISRGFRGYIILLKLFSLSVLFVSPFWTGVQFTSLQVLLLAITAAASLYLTIDAMNLKVFDRNEIGRRWVKQGIQPRNSPGIKFSAPAHIANPGREIGYSDQFLIQPSKICHRFHAHHTRQTFWAMQC